MAASAAVKLRFTDWFPTGESSDAKEKVALMQKEDSTVLTEIDTKVD